MRRRGESPSLLRPRFFQEKNLQIPGSVRCVRLTVRRLTSWIDSEESSMDGSSPFVSTCSRRQLARRRARRSLLARTLSALAGYRWPLAGCWRRAERWCGPAGPDRRDHRRQRLPRRARHNLGDGPTRSCAALKSAARALSRRAIRSTRWSSRSTSVPPGSPASCSTSGPNPSAVPTASSRSTSRCPGGWSMMPARSGPSRRRSPAGR